MSVAALITRKPLLPVITLKKNDNSLYTFNPFTSTFDFRVIRLQVRPPYSSDAGLFTLELTSSDAGNTGANTLISNLNEGNEVTIWIGKSDSTKMKIFTGVIESWVIDESNKNYMGLTIQGPDFGSDILNNRIVFGKWAQLLDTNGDPVVTDNTTTIQQIVIDMLTKETYYPDQTELVTIEDQGIIVTASNIKGEDLKLKSFTSNYEFAGDKIRSLGELGGMIHWVDADKVFHFEYPTTTSSASSGVLITDDNTDATALAWLPQTKIGLIAPPTKYERTLEHHKRRIFGMGGVNISPDQYSRDDLGSTTLETNNLGMSFVPKYSTVSKVTVKISRVGTPIEDFVLELREDYQGLPTGKVLRTISKPKAFLNTDTDAHWSTFEINEDVIIGQTYWIVVRKNGTSASNTFRWHHDGVNHSTSLSAFSPTDGLVSPDWQLFTSGKYYYTFEQYKGDEIFTIETQKPITATTKHHHDDIIRKDDITDDMVMDLLVKNESKTLFKRKEILKCSVYAPDVLLMSGQKVYVRKQASGYKPTDPITGNTCEFILGSVEYVFESSEDQSTGAFYYLIEAVRYVAI